MNVRTYGSEPFRVAVLHGGPGAPGYMAPVARELARMGVSTVEPLQTQSSLDGQIAELRDQLAGQGPGPWVLVGSSWGACLALLFAGRHPALVSRLVLSGSAVLDAAYAPEIQATRAERLSPSTSARLERLARELTTSANKNLVFKDLADCYLESDLFDPLTRNLEILECEYDVYNRVWEEFRLLRENPDAIKFELRRVKSPAVLVHGDHDPHPIAGIEPFLRECLADLRVEWLSDCGHYPWLEARGRARFFEILRRECSFDTPSDMRA